MANINFVPDVVLDECLLLFVEQLHKKSSNYVKSQSNRCCQYKNKYN
jgi:hypothetical protein